MTGLSNNPIVRQESIYKALDKLVITPQEARVYLEFGNADQMLEEIQKEREIADKIVQGITDPNNYLPNGACKVVQHMWDNHALVIERLLVYMRENYDGAPAHVKKTLDEQLQWHQQVAAALKAPAARPSPDSMTPEGGFGGGQAGENAPGLMQPESQPGADSVQNPNQQPDRSRIPLPASTGLQNA